MQKLSLFVCVFLFLAVPALACLTEEDITTRLQTAYEGVQVQERFEALRAKKFMELFTQVVGVDEAPPPIDLVVVYSKPDAVAHKLVFYIGGCMVGHGYVLPGAYAEILAKLLLAMAI
jgi:hypothetical protein